MDAAKFQQELMTNTNNMLMDNLSNIPGFPVDDPILVSKVMEISNKATIKVIARLFEICSDEELSLMEEQFKMSNNPKMRAIMKKALPIMMSTQQEVIQKMMEVFGF